MRILIRGGGDLATGILSRLYGAGHQVLVTEKKEPLAVRRTVAVSRAVYEGRARVEQMEAELARDRQEAERILGEGRIPVLVDEQASCRQWYKPDVVVDAILAKRNLGTSIKDAPFVVGVGPGFTAGVDCHCVIETKRGHTLGSLIWDGAALPNTGVPGEVGGYTTERLLRAEQDGSMEPRASIGDYVVKGQIVAYTGGVPVYAKMNGIVRGMLQEGAAVQKGLKIGDIDARAVKEHCYSISDKARAIGGGVLEAVESYGKRKGKFATVLLAAGKSLRFGTDKLGEIIEGKTLYRWALEKTSALEGCPVYVVVGTEERAEEAKRFGLIPVINEAPEEGISRSIRLGLSRAICENPKLEGALFCVCDQPFLRLATMGQVLRLGARHPGAIVRPRSEESEGNPVFWNRIYFDELLSLRGDEGGRQLVGKYRSFVKWIPVDSVELRDLDSREELGRLTGRKEYGGEL